MQILLAYAWERDASAERIQAGLSRIEQWYGRLWDGVSAAAAATDRLGLQLWHRTDEPCRWPAWATCGSGTVATLHVPLGYQRLVGPATLEHAPVALARRLHDHPAEVMRLTAPFVLALLDSGTATLELWTDGLGLGRLYEVRTEEGRIWSNRPVAALLFAGLRAEADPLAWRRMAACDWAMGDETPYRGVRTIPAGTHVLSDRSGHREQSLDVLGSLVGSRWDPLAEQTVADTAAGLTGVARSVSELWPGVPVLSLSGGRDPRLVVAAFVAAGVEVRLKTSGGAAGEADTARELVSRLGGRVEHEVTVPTAQQPGRLRDGAYARARQWHDMTEGLRPALYLRRVAPRSLMIERLVPAWSDVPFYSATLKQRSAVQQQRLWEEVDVDLLSGVIADPDDWGDGFDVTQVQEIWRGRWPVGRRRATSSCCSGWCGGRPSPTTSLRSTASRCRSVGRGPWSFRPGPSGLQRGSCADWPFVPTICRWRGHRWAAS